MTDTEPKERSSFGTRVKEILDDTDIRLLVYGPPVLSVVGLLTLALIHKLLGLQMSSAVSELAIGLAALFCSLAGIAEIYKKQMPGPLGGVVEGGMAAASGVFIVLVFGTAGIYEMLSGLRQLLVGP